MSDEAIVFVRRGAQWLVLHRSEAQGAYWHVVAGAVEADEDDAAAAARELREEVGLVAEPRDLGTPFTYVPEPWESRSARSRPVAVACFLVDAPPGWEPVLDWEHDAYRWCSVPEALALLRWPEPRRVLEGVA